jgi:hypothetical protein
MTHHICLVQRLGTHSKLVHIGYSSIRLKFYQAYGQGVKMTQHIHLVQRSGTHSKLVRIRYSSIQLRGQKHTAHWCASVTAAFGSNSIRHVDKV